MEFTPLPSEMPESPGSDVSDEASESTPDISAGDSSAETERLNLNNEGAVDSHFTRLAAPLSWPLIRTIIPRLTPFSGTLTGMEPMMLS